MTNKIPNSKSQISKPPFAFNSQENVLMNNMGISALILFGSHAQGIASPRSDFDFGVILNDPKICFLPEQRKVIYDALYDLLSAKIKQLVNIDIVFLQNAPMELKSHVAQYGILLYEKTPDVFFNFKEQVMNFYADFAPLRKIFHQAILARIPDLP